MLRGSSNFLEKDRKYSRAVAIATPGSWVQLPWNVWTYTLCTIIMHNEMNKTAHMIFCWTFFFLLLIVCTDIYTFKKCGEESKLKKNRQTRKEAKWRCEMHYKSFMNNTVYSIINSLDVIGDNQCCISK